MTEADWRAQRDEAVPKDVRARGARLLEVKSLGPSKDDPNYARTRHFCEKLGFLPLEETAGRGPFAQTVADRVRRAAGEESN